jgi:hypothetical protein
MSIDSIVITALREKEKEIESQLNELRAFINSFIANGGGTSISHANNELPNNTKTAEKRPYNLTVKRRRRTSGDASEPIVAKMKQVGKFMHRSEIADLMNMEPVKLTGILSTAARGGKHELVNFVPGKTKNQTVWGFRSWLGADGKPTVDHMYNDEYVMSRK